VSRVRSKRFANGPSDADQIGLTQVVLENRPLSGCLSTVISTLWYGVGIGNTVAANSSMFSLI